MTAKNATAGATVAKKPKVLTEEALLKAPEKDYMNDAQLAFSGSSCSSFARSC
jgi:hypothetical protein